MLMSIFKSMSLESGLYTNIFFFIHIYTSKVEG